MRKYGSIQEGNEEETMSGEVEEIMERRERLAVRNKVKSEKPLRGTRGVKRRGRK